MTTARLARAALLGALATASAGCAGPNYQRPEVKLTEPGCNESPDRGALEQVRIKVATAKATGKIPVVVFDLDDTLVDTATRTRAIFADALRSPRAPGDAEPALEQLDYVCLGEYGVGVDRNIGLGGYSRNTQRYLLDEWTKSAFSERYVDRAVPFRGAALFVNDLRIKGAKIVYLSNRDGRNLRAATLRALEARGFPVESNGAVLLMQNGGPGENRDWTEGEAEMLSTKGTVVAAFDNEPEDVRMYRRLYPEAISVLMVSRHREDHPRVPEGTQCIVDYRERL